MARLALLALVAAGSTWACSTFGGPGGASTGCSGFQSGGACTEQSDRIASRHPGASSVDLTCTVGVCDRRGGSGTVVVTMRDGSVARDTFAYVGDPAPMPQPACLGVAIDACRSVATSLFNDASPSRRIVAISVACQTPPCTAAKGDTAYVVTYADGRTDNGSMGWDGGLP